MRLIWKTDILFHIPSCQGGNKYRVAKRSEIGVRFLFYIRFAHAHGLTPVARLSVTTFAPLTPLPPFISLRALRTSSASPRLRVSFLFYVRFAQAHGLTPVARLSVTTLASLPPLPPSISLRTLRTLREISSATGTAAIWAYRRFLAGRWTRRRQAAALPELSHYCLELISPIVFHLIAESPRRRQCRR